MTFASDSTTGFYKYGANTIGWSIVLRGAQFQLEPTGYVQWVGQTTFKSPADGQLNVMTNVQTAGTGFDVATDAVLKIRTRAQTGYATVDALGYKVSGVAGVAAFGPSAVASITIVNGIVTAIS